MGKVTHYCSIERANESDNNDYYSKSACGLEYFENGDDNPNYVTCKNCLRVMAKSNKKAKATLPINIVSQQRELLLAFADWQDTELEGRVPFDNSKDVDAFLKANNCG